MVDTSYGRLTAGSKGYMDIAYLSTLSALAGSVVGGLTSGVATWLSQRAQARESELAREMGAPRRPL
jgi:hypothetical protein